MEKTRVKKGEKYWYLDLVYLDVIETQEMNSGLDNFHYRKNNYFATKEQAIAMAAKLRAVLNGADVIEMPSEEDCETFAVELARRNAFVSETFSTREDWRMSSRMTVDWLKSKIVK